MQKRYSGLHEVLGLTMTIMIMMIMMTMMTKMTIMTVTICIVQALIGSPGKPQGLAVSLLVYLVLSLSLLLSSCFVILEHYMLITLYTHYYTS